jgi:hypothetical protein
MRLDELFRAPSFSADEVRLRMKNSKSPEEKAKWAALLPKESLAEIGVRGVGTGVMHPRPYPLSEEALKPYLDRLVSKEGIKKLGGGAFSQVFQHPHYGNVVVKVYTDRDVIYKKYAAWCMKHQHNPYVPKIIEQTKYKSPETGEKYNIIFIQKMTPIKTSGKLVSLLVKALELDTKAAEDLPFMTAFGQLGKEKEDFRLIDKYVKMGRGDKDFKEIWAHIKTYGANRFDLHPGNVMLRDGQLVLTDPVANDPGSQRVDEL